MCIKIFFKISLSFLHINDVTIPIFESEGRKQETELAFDKVSELEYRDRG